MSVSDVEKKLRTWSILCSTAPTGIKKGVRLACLCILLWLLLASACMANEPAHVPKLGVNTVWTDGSGKHSSNPHFRRCGVGYVTDTGE
eukprot:3528924-Amphidinium_carterae.1